MEKLMDVPNVSSSREDVVVKRYTSSASTSNIYTAEMAKMASKINYEPATSDVNKIN